jgi:hypothetical protein
MVDEKNVVNEENNQEEEKTKSLTSEEISIIRQYQSNIMQKKVALANLRQQYLAAESNIFNTLSKSEVDFVSHLKMLATNKGIDPEQGSWIFDPQAYIFKKNG